MSLHLMSCKINLLLFVPDAFTGSCLGWTFRRLRDQTKYLLESSESLPRNFVFHWPSFAAGYLRRLAGLRDGRSIGSFHCSNVLLCITLAITAVSTLLPSYPRLLKGRLATPCCNIYKAFGLENASYVCICMLPLPVALTLAVAAAVAPHFPAELT